MKKGIMVFIAFLLMAVFNISQSPLYAASTGSATFTEKPSDIGKTGLRIEKEQERIPSTGQKTNETNNFPGFMKSAARYTDPYEYGVTIIEPLSGQNRSKVYGINNSGQVVGKSYNYTAEADDFIIDHRCTDISQIPEEWINSAKADLHIAYGHTSHGSQLITGMNGLDAFMGGTGLYVWNDGPLAGALDIDDYFVDGDLGNPDTTAWEQRTRTYLDDPANSDVNVVIWSWCGQANTTVENIDLYLSLMTGLETNYPNVKFVYMTGHLNGGGLTGNLHLRNEQIRTYCRDNNKILYDFADIETYDPDGTYFGDKIPDDTCAYDTDNNGTRDGNWAIEWQDLHIEGVDWYNCSPAHTQPLNGNLKAYAAWWLWARVAGWLSEELVLSNQAFIWDSTNGYKVLPPLVVNAESGVWGINDNGQVSGHSYNADELEHAVRWDNTGGLVQDIVVVDIGTLTNTTTGVSGETSTSYGINNLGQVAGYSDIPNDDGLFIAFHAFKYDDATGLQDLGTLTTHAPYYQNGYSISYCINSSEQTVGLAHNSLWEVLAFIHDETSGMQALSIDPAYSGCEWHAAVINDSGFIGGRVIAAKNQLLPYYWENSSASPVRIAMPAAFPYGEIYGINESGQMVGMMWDTDQEDAVEHAFIFDIQNGVRDLNDLIDPGSQFVLQNARDINNSGQISGTCIYNDEKRGFLLDPKSDDGVQSDDDVNGGGGDSSSGGGCFISATGSKLPINPMGILFMLLAGTGIISLVYSVRKRMT